MFLPFQEIQDSAQADQQTQTQAAEGVWQLVQFLHHNLQGNQNYVCLLQNSFDEGIFYFGPKTNMKEVNN